MTRHEPGDRVWFHLRAAGPSPGRLVGEVDCIVLNAGSEYDLLISPAEPRDQIAEWLERCDMTLADVREGPVLVLRNCQPEDVLAR